MTGKTKKDILLDEIHYLSHRGRLTIYNTYSDIHTNLIRFQSIYYDKVQCISIGKKKHVPFLIGNLTGYLFNLTLKLMWEDRTALAFKLENESDHV